MYMDSFNSSNIETSWNISRAVKCTCAGKRLNVQIATRPGKFFEFIREFLTDRSKRPCQVGIELTTIGDRELTRSFLFSKWKEPSRERGMIAPTIYRE